MADRTEYYKQYYLEHKAERKARIREWRQKNPDKVKEYNKAYQDKLKGQTDDGRP